MHSSDTDEEEDAVFYAALSENTYLADVYSTCKSPRRFLARSQRIYARSTRVDRAASDVWLEYETDIDGCVIELSSLTGVELPIRHVTICPTDYGKLKDVKSLLKKHVNLVEYSKEARENFNDSVGMQLFYEGGWECWLALIPDSAQRSIRLSREVIRNLASCAFNQLRFNLRKKLTELARQDLAMQTLKKNNLDDLRKIFVLPGDRSVMLEAIQSVVSELNVKTFKPLLFCVRFGEKMSNGMLLSGFRLECIQKLTVHTAVNVSSRVPGAQLCWSMNGIHEVIGHRGTVSTCLSMADCGTYQSNLDGRPMDIKPELRSVGVHPDKITFVQLYADVPHLRPKVRFHPVSGTIAGGLCFPKPMLDAFSRDAETYVSSMEQNFSLLRRSTCRLEIVTELTPSCNLVQVSECLEIERVIQLLEVKPMIVPIPTETLDCIRNVGLWLCEELKDMLASFAKTGNVSATWRAFQMELACEKLLWGRPLCVRSRPYSVNLGPGSLGPSRSLTDHLGFLALESHTSCMTVENSMPPYEIWTGSHAIGQAILRVAGVHDHIDASYPVIGRLLMLALLRDLHEIGNMARHFRFEDFLLTLKQTDCRFKCVGAIGSGSLAEVLCSKRRTPVRMVFGSLCKLMKKHGLPLREVIEAGISDLGLHQFPAFDTYDVHGHAVIALKFRFDFWKVLRSSEACSAVDPFSTELYSNVAKGVLETRGLIFPSRLKKLPASLPWIGPCLRKLVGEKLSDKQTALVLAFLSALAFIMQGWFVDYDRFSELFKDLPVQQFRLKTLEIQSKLELPKFKFQNLRIYRLHESIPHQVKREESERFQTNVDPEFNEEQIVAQAIADAESTRNRIRDDDSTCVENQNIQPWNSVCLPAALHQRAWTPAEMEILDRLSSDRFGKTLKDLYSCYRTQCLSNDVPFRTFQAFSTKLKRLR